MTTTTAERTTQATIHNAESLISFFRNLTWEADGHGATADPRNNEEVLTDIICDLYHWAWEVDEDFQACVEQAIKHGRTERAVIISKGDIL